MNVRLRMYEYCYSNLGAIYAKGLYFKLYSTRSRTAVFQTTYRKTIVSQQSKRSKREE